MASDYGRNFGFRRSDESYRSAEGRYSTPAGGSALLLGTAVCINDAAPGYLKVAPSNTALVTGVSGILVQEEIWDRSIYGPELVDSYTSGVALQNRLSVITSGQGVKFWLRNTASETRADGRVIAAVTMYTAGGLAVGETIGWDGTKWVEVAGGVTNAWATVLSINSTTGRLEAVLNA